MTISRRSLGVGVLALLAACSPYPRDPGHTLDAIRRRGTVRIGMSPAEPWVMAGDAATSPLVSVDGVRLAGSEVALMLAFAAHLGVEPEWTLDGEAGLVEKVETGALDLVAAGLTDATQWSKMIGITRGYVKYPNAQGKKEKHVFGLPLGENALLAELERFLDAQPAEKKEPRA